MKLVGGTLADDFDAIFVCAPLDTGASGDDFNCPVFNNITILAGASTGTAEITFTPVDDAEEEGPEAVEFWMAVTIPGLGATNALAYLTILDDDATPSFGARRILNQSYRQDTPVAQTLPAATGGNEPLSYSLSPSPPAGLGFDAATRRLTGTPTGTQGATTYTYTATDRIGQTATLTFTITVGADRAPSFGDNRIANLTYTENTPIAAQTLPRATGGDGTLRYSLSPAPPAGLSFDVGTRRLTGTPVGTHAAATYTWTATDADGDTATLTFTITVAAGTTPPSFGAGSIPNQSYTQNTAIPALTLPAATGGRGALRYSLSPSAPAGLAFDAATRRLTGRPTGEQDATTYTYTVTDAGGNAAALTFTIAIEAAGEDIEVPEDLPAELARVPRNVTVSGTGVVSWTLDTETEPAGGTHYWVDWTADELPPSRKSWPDGEGSIWERHCPDNGICEVQIEDFDPGLHYLVHVTTAARSFERLAPVAVRYTPPEGEETDLTGVPKDVAVSSTGLVTWQASASEDDYTVGWSQGGNRKGTKRRGYEIVDVRDCDGLSCAFQIPNFDSGLDWLVDVNTLDREMDGLDPVRVRYTAVTPTASVAAGAAVDEGTAASFTVTLSSAAPSGGVTVNLTVSEASGSDYVASRDEGDKTVSFAAGETSKAYSVPTVGDTADEPDGSVTVTLTGGTGYVLGAPKTASVTVRNDDDPALPAATIEAGTSPVTEGTAASFTVTLSMAAPADGLTLAYVVSEDSDGDGDFVAAGDEGAKTLAIAEGATTATLSVPTADDDADEYEGLVTVTLDEADESSYALGTPSSASVTVHDDDGPVRGEPVDRGGDEQITVYHDPDSPTEAVNRYDEAVELLEAVQRQYVVVSGAVADEVDRLAGVTNSVLPRFFLGNPEAADWGPSEPGVNNGGLRWLRSVVGEPKEPAEPPPAPTASIEGGAAVDEGAEASFTVTLSEAAPADGLTLAYVVSEDGEFVADADEGAQTVAVAAGDTSATLSVPTADDDADEDDGTVTVTLESGDGYEVGDPSSASVTVRDDDEAEVVELEDGAIAVYHDPAHSADATGRYDEAVGLLTDAGRAYTVRTVTGTGEVERLAGVTGTVMPRFFLGDPESAGWGPSEPGTNNGGLRWLRRLLEQPQEPAEPVTPPGAAGPELAVADARVTEAPGAVLAFAVTLDPAASAPVTVDYRTVDGTAAVGADYLAASGSLAFAAGETEKTVSVTVVDDSHDEGEETLRLVLSNASGASLADAEATGTIVNTDLIPAALLARFGRATAEQVVDQVEERMVASRERGFRARLAGREYRPGMERDFALGFLSQFGAPMGAAEAVGGAALGGAGATVTGSHLAGAHGADTTGLGGALGTTGRQPSPDGGVFGALAPGGDLLSRSEFELNRASHGGVLSLWSRSSRSYFNGMEETLSLNGDVRTTMVGADWARGPLTVGLSVGHTRGAGGYDGRSAGQMTTAMTGFYPWLGYQVNDRVSVWAVTGYGKGSLSLTPDGAGALETGMSMAMTAVGTRGELLGSGAAGGFGLAFKADALWVGAASELLDGPAGRLNASESGATRMRTALEGSRGFTLGDGRMSLTPSVEVGLRRDGGDAETGAGMDLGGGVVFTDSVMGLSLDVRGRTLLLHQAEGFAERGMSLSLGWDPTPSSPLGLSARVAPSWGGQTMGGAEALWSGQMASGPGAQPMSAPGGQFNAEVGYGLPVGARFVGTPRVGVMRSPHGREYRAGYGLGVLESGRLHFDLGLDARRRESSMQGVADNGFLVRATLGW